MTDRPPPDEAPPAPPTTDQEQSPADGRVKWTRDQKLAWWANAASFVNVGAALAAFLLLVQTLRITQDTLAVSQQTVEETKRQADIAQDALVAATRARLKVTAITNVLVTRLPSSGAGRFHFKPTYKNFGQSPAQDIFFSPHVFVVGAGPPPKRTCEGDKGRFEGASTEIVFPQDEGGQQQTGVQIQLNDIEAQAAKVRAIQPTATIYLGIIGCLTYRSTGSDDIHVTGFEGGLHPLDKKDAEQWSYISLYDVLMDGGGPMNTEIQVKVLSAWAD